MLQVRKKKKFGLRVSAAINPVPAILCVLPALIGVFAISVFPACLNVFLSLVNYNGSFENLKFVGLSNYTSYLSAFGWDMLDALKNTGIYMLLVIIPVQIFALISATFVNMQRVKCKTIFRAIFFLPNILGISVVCTLWGIMLDPLDGPFAAMLESLHKILPFIPENSAFLGSEKTAMLCVAIVSVWASFGFSMALYLAAMTGVSKDYYEVAELEGLRGFGLFFKITLPLIWPAVTVCLFIALQGTIGMSDYVILLTGGGRGTTTIGFYLYNIVMKATVTQGQAAAVSICFSIITGIVMMLFEKFVRRREVEL